MQLSPPAQRVLGCLIEKALATPQGYPLTRNALRTACNQATNRDPIVDYDDNAVEDALAELRGPSLVRTEVVRGSRTPKYAHRVEQELGFDQRDQAVIALLLLRGAQTEGELNNRSGRLYEFASLDEVDQALASLAQRGYVQRLERRPGEKAPRWHHTLGDGTPASPPSPTGEDHEPVEHGSHAPTGPRPSVDEIADLRARVTALEQEVSRLRATIEDPSD